jgi:UDP-N-acetylglucosamine 2-epimerase (non-hydrolysing)
MIQVLSVFGTRPEAVKMAPVVLELRRNPDIDAKVCVTAQHRQMLDQVLDIFHITPDIDLDLMRPDQSLAQVTAAVFSYLDPILEKFHPQWLLVQGDTTTVMAASLLAYYHQIRVGHVEAGLRTGDKWQPFPEEINRRVAGAVADLHFAPTVWAKSNLLREGVDEEKILVTGNPVIDALQMVADMPPSAEAISLLEILGLTQSLSSRPRLVLVTAHRRENFGQPLVDICTALRCLAEIYRDEVQFVYPVHLNPNVGEPVYRLLKNIPNLTLLSPLNYLPMIHLLKHTTLLLTDSGGLQEEAPGLGVPVLVLRRVTERPEGIEAGTVRLVGTSTENIISETRKLLDNPQEYARMAQAVNPYGDGHAAERIVKAIIDYN